MQRKYGGLELWGCDIEALAVAVLNAWQRRNTRLNPDDFDDALAFIVAAGWELSTRYEAGRYSSFADYARTILTHRIVDWLRQDEGRSTWAFAEHTYSRERVAPLSLDGPARRDDDGDAVRLGELVAVRGGGDETDRVALLERLERDRDRYRARDLNVIRQSLYQRVAA